MTVIVYHQDALGTDSRGISNQGEHNEAHYAMKKLFVYEREGLPIAAVAKLDEPFPIEMAEAILTIIVHGCKTIEVSGEISKLPIEPVLLDSLGTEQLSRMIIMTKRHVYRFSDTDLYQQLETGPLFMGSGSGVVRTAIFGFGAGIEDAIKKAIELDQCCGGEINIVRRKDLKFIPLPKKVKVKKNA